MRRQNTTYYYMLDALGSVRKLTDSSQATTDSYSYEAFGAIVASAGSTTNPYRYVGSLGYYRDSTSGLLHVGTRYYWPAVGRFTTQDPFREAENAREVGRAGATDKASANWYQYVGNSPASKVDPEGLQFPDLVPGALATGCCIISASNRATQLAGKGLDLLGHCYFACAATRCLDLNPLGALAVYLEMKRRHPERQHVDANAAGIRCAYKFWYLSCEHCCRHELHGHYRFTPPGRPRR
jgi:RHS repeat-associated protein